MNQTQKCYLIKRIRQVMNAKLSGIKRKELLPAKSISGEMRLKLVKTGRVKIRRGVTQIKSYTDVTDVFDFEPFERDAVYNDEIVETQREKIKTAAQNVEDQVMLGDSETALQMLTDFEKLKFPGVK